MQLNTICIYHHTTATVVTWLRRDNGMTSFVPSFHSSLFPVPYFPPWQLEDCCKFT